MAAFGAVAYGAPKKAAADLGKVLYIGDSITHGFRAPSYRWALHKIFVDNGIAYEEIGIETGSHSNGVAPNTMYIGRAFKNVHAAMSGERAYEVSNRLHVEGKRLNDSSIFHWLGLPEDAEGKEVKEIDKRKLSAMPNICFILLGTNDMLSDYGTKGGIAKNYAPVEKALLDKKKGDMHVIVKAIRSVNPQVKLVILSVPTWYDTANNNTAQDYKVVVKTYNKKLAAAFKKETFVDLNQGLVDICCGEKPERAVANFFNARDKLHPSLQGDLIMAGLVARTMGYAGRSAGMVRKDATAFSSSAADIFARAAEKENVEQEGGKLVLKAGGKMVSPWPEGADVAKGFAAEWQMNVGNGASGGWDQSGVTFSIGNGVHSGRVKLTEGYILWGDEQVLYPIDMSGKKVAPIRVAWVPGSSLLNVAKGFYVWLGDMLIGEALPDNADKMSGIAVQNNTANDEVVKTLAVDDKPLAPASKGLIVEEVHVAYDEDQEAAPAK